MINKIKCFLKKNKWALSFFEFFFRRNIENYFSKKFSKRVLISYSTYHFARKGYTGHSNYQESAFIAETFDKLGYVVDIINNDRLFKGDLNRYDVVFGEGYPMYQAAISKSKAKIIYYATGSHPFHCSLSSVNRLIEFSRTHKYTPVSSMRLSPFEWGIAASLADNVLCIGNHTTKKSFIDNQVKNIDCIDPTYIIRPDALSIVKERCISQSRNNILWFGSYGLLHKGLDLAVDAVREKSNFTLYICGHIDVEDDFLQGLDLPDNVIKKGFLDIMSEDFKELALNSAFVMLPSCSEGISTAIITVAGNSGMIPIVTPECGVDIEDFGYTIEQSVDSIISILNEIELLSEDEIRTFSEKSFSSIQSRYTAEKFRNKLENYLTNILK